MIGGQWETRARELEARVRELTEALAGSRMMAATSEARVRELEESLDSAERHVLKAEAAELAALQQYDLVAVHKDTETKRADEAEARVRELEDALRDIGQGCKAVVRQRIAAVLRGRSASQG